MSPLYIQGSSGESNLLTRSEYSKVIGEGESERKKFAVNSATEIGNKKGCMCSFCFLKIRQMRHFLYSLPYFCFFQLKC